MVLSNCRRIKLKHGTIIALYIIDNSTFICILMMQRCLSNGELKLQTVRQNPAYNSNVKPRYIMATTYNGAISKALGRNEHLSKMILCKITVTADLVELFYNRERGSRVVDVSARLITKI